MNRRAISVLMVIMLFSSVPIAMLGSQADTTVTSGSVECDTSLQMLPMSRDIGGGTIHWRITGTDAQILRQLILDRLDNATINKIGPTENTRQRNVIDQYEIMAFVGSPNSYLQHYIEGNIIQHVNYSRESNPFEPVGPEKYPDGAETGKPIYYEGVKITHSALSNNNVHGDTNGLEGSPRGDVGAIDIYMTIKMDSAPKAAEITMSDPVLVGAPFECLTQWDKVPIYDTTRNTTSWELQATNKTVFRGNGVLSHTTISIGFDSYSYPNVQGGSIWMLRTPAGEVFGYSTEINRGNASGDTIQHSPFDPLENPQILFIVMVIFGYLSVAFPTHFYLVYRNSYPKRYRMEAQKIRWLQWTGRIFLLLLIIFYFFPIIGPIYFSGPIMLVLGIVFVIISAVLSKYTYEKAIENIPKEYFEEEKKPKKRIPRAPAPVPAPMRDLEEYEPEPLPMMYGEEEEERIHCIRCGSLIKIKEGENLLKVKCPVCGALQKRVERGYNHLILDSELKNTYNMLADFLRDRDTALCLSTTFPDKLKRTYGLTGRIKCIWLSNAGGKDTIEPADMDKIADTVERFSQKYPASVVLLDGLEYLVVEQGFDDAMEMVKKITDVASMRDMTLLVPINPAALTSEELTTIKAEFDRVEALEDKDERSFY